jgi:glycosyltransferase involved in cell wall biosynthesis
MTTTPKNLICLSHLRWDFVYQRPQHLLTRFAKYSNVYFYEEPIFDATDYGYLSISKRTNNVLVAVPHLKPGLSDAEIDKSLSNLFDQFMDNFEIDDCLFWYYTPMALNYSGRHKPKLTVYDCMDELSGFKFAPPALVKLEKELMAKADVVFTGGYSLYEAKKQYHANIFPHPSSIDKKHFAGAKTSAEAADQKEIAGPKVGFYGVVDERFDLKLLGEMADARPELNFIIIGPVVKIDPETLPKNRNIHYLGQKSYQELPAYLAGWDVALIPFLLNESTKFISPTKTPEYLAAGIPVVSTAIKDVINPYGVKKLVHICNNCDDFVAAIDEELHKTDRTAWTQETAQFLKQISWDKTFETMNHQIKNAISTVGKISIAS